MLYKKYVRICDAWQQLQGLVLCIYVGATQRTFALDCALWSDCVVYDRINISYFFLSTLTQ